MRRAVLFDGWELMRSLLKNLLPALASIGTLGFFLVLYVSVPGPFGHLRLTVFDAYQKVNPRSRSTKPVVVVDIDDESLRRYGQWPWSRHVVADLVRSIQDSGAKAIGLDLLFSEPDRTSPAHLVGEWQRQFGFRAESADAPLPDFDQQLAGVVARGRVVTGFVVQPEPNSEFPDNLTSIGLVGTPDLPRFGGTIPNLPVLEAAAAGHGTFTVRGGPDEINRSVPMVVRVGDQIVPSLALETLRVLLDEDTLTLRTDHWHGTISGYTLRVGDIDLPLDRDGTLWLHYPNAGSTPTLPAWKLLDPVQRVRLPAALKDAAVLVGTSAKGLGDLRPTPMSAFEPGVNIHASAIEQAVEHRFVVRPIWAESAEIGAAVLIAMAIAALASAGALVWAALLAVGSAAIAGWTCVRLFVDQGLLFDPSAGTIMVGTVLVVAGVTRYAQADRAAQRLRIAFTHYLSPELVSALVQQPDKLKLGGESREMTFLFTDLEGFTSLTEQAGAEALVSLLNDYLDNLCRIAMDHGGTVDKMVGDAMHVMFNAPLDQPDHESRAVACALALDQFAQGFAAEQRRQGVPFGVTRIGVNTGRAVVGNFGGSRRFDYTAHGDAINTAARLEAANKTLGTRICVSRATMERAPDHLFRPIGALMLKGKSSAVEVYEPLADSTPRAEAARFADVLQRFMNGDAAAMADLVRLHQQQPNDPVLSLYARRIAAGDLSCRIAA